MENIESRDKVVDLKLLAKIVLVREELRLIDQEFHGISSSKLTMNIMRHQVPITEMTFINELLLVRDKNMRKAIIKNAFMGKSDTAYANVFHTDNEEQLRRKNYKISYVIEAVIRPGRLMDSIYMTKAELFKKDSKAQARLIDVVEIWLESSKSIEEIAHSDM